MQSEAEQFVDRAPDEWPVPSFFYLDLLHRSGVASAEVEARVAKVERDHLSRAEDAASKHSSDRCVLAKSPAQSQAVNTSYKCLTCTTEDSTIHVCEACIKTCHRGCRHREEKAPNGFHCACGGGTFSPGKPCRLLGDLPFVPVPLDGDKAAPMPTLLEAALKKDLDVIRALADLIESGQQSQALVDVCLKSLWTLCDVLSSVEPGGFAAESAGGCADHLEALFYDLLARTSALVACIASPVLTAALSLALACGTMSKLFEFCSRILSLHDDRETNGIGDREVHLTRIFRLFTERSLMLNSSQESSATLFDSSSALKSFSATLSKSSTTAADIGVELKVDEGSDAHAAFRMHSFASDGDHLYIHSPKLGLWKFGSGYGGTQAGKLVATNRDLVVSALDRDRPRSWIGVCRGQLWFAMLPVVECPEQVTLELTRIDTETLKPAPDSTRSHRFSHPQCFMSLTCNAEAVFVVFAQSKKPFIVHEIDPQAASLPVATHTLRPTDVMPRASLLRFQSPKHDARYGAIRGLLDNGKKAVVIAENSSPDQPLRDPLYDLTSVVRIFNVSTSYQHGSVLLMNTGELRFCHTTSNRITDAIDPRKENAVMLEFPMKLRFKAVSVVSYLPDRAFAKKVIIAGIEKKSGALWLALREPVTTISQTTPSLCTLRMRLFDKELPDERFVDVAVTEERIFLVTDKLEVKTMPHRIALGSSLYSSEEVFKHVDLNNLVSLPLPFDASSEGGIRQISVNEHNQVMLLTESGKVYWKCIPAVDPESRDDDSDDDLGSDSETDGDNKRGGADGLSLSRRDKGSVVPEVDPGAYEVNLKTEQNPVVWHKALLERGIKFFGLDADLKRCVDIARRLERGHPMFFRLSGIAKENKSGKRVSMMFDHNHSKQIVYFCSPPSPLCDGYQRRCQACRDLGHVGDNLNDALPANEHKPTPCGQKDGIAVSEKVQYFDRTFSRLTLAPRSFTKFTRGNGESAECKGGEDANDRDDNSAECKGIEDADERDNDSAEQKGVEDANDRDGDSGKLKLQDSEDLSKAPDGDCNDPQHVQADSPDMTGYKDEDVTEASNGAGGGDGDAKEGKLVSETVTVEVPLPKAVKVACNALEVYVALCDDGCLYTWGRELPLSEYLFKKQPSGFATRARKLTFDELDGKFVIDFELAHLNVVIRAAPGCGPEDINQVENHKFYKLRLDRITKDTGNLLHLESLSGKSIRAWSNVLAVEGEDPLTRNSRLGDVVAPLVAFATDCQLTLAASTDSEAALTYDLKDSFQVASRRLGSNRSSIERRTSPVDGVECGSRVYDAINDVLWSTEARTDRTLKVTSYLSKPHFEGGQRGDVALRRLLHSNVIAPARMRRPTGDGDAIATSSSAEASTSPHVVAMSVLCCLTLYHPKGSLASDDTMKVENELSAVMSHFDKHLSTDACSEFDVNGVVICASLMSQLSQEIVRGLAKKRKTKKRRRKIFGSLPKSTKEFLADLPFGGQLLSMLERHYAHLRRTCGLERLRDVYGYLARAICDGVEKGISRWVDRETFLNVLIRNDLSDIDRSSKEPLLGAHVLVTQALEMFALTPSVHRLFFWKGSVTPSVGEKALTSSGSTHAKSRGADSPKLAGGDSPKSRSRDSPKPRSVDSPKSSALESVAKAATSEPFGADTCASFCFVGQFIIDLIDATVFQAPACDVVLAAVRELLAMQDAKSALLNEFLARIFEQATLLFEKAMKTLSQDVSSTKDTVSRDPLFDSHYVSVFLPTLITEIFSLVRARPDVAAHLEPMLTTLFRVIASVNRLMPEDELSSHEQCRSMTFNLESEHPYGAGTWQLFSIDFPDYVSYYTIEFDSRSVLDGQEDEVTLYTSQADLDAEDRHTKRFVGKYRLGTPPARTVEGFPRGPVLVRGNTLCLQFSTSNAAPNDGDRFGFRCSVTGFVHSDAHRQVSSASLASASVVTSATHSHGLSHSDKLHSDNPHSYISDSDDAPRRRVSESTPADPMESTRRSLLALEKALALTVSQVACQLLRPSSSSLMLRDDERELLDRLSTPLLQGGIPHDRLLDLAPSERASSVLEHLHGTPKGGNGLVHGKSYAALPKSKSITKAETAAKQSNKSTQFLSALSQVSAEGSLRKLTTPNSEQDEAKDPAEISMSALEASKGDVGDTSTSSIARHPDDERALAHALQSYMCSTLELPMDATKSRIRAAIKDDPYHVFDGYKPNDAASKFKNLHINDRTVYFENVTLRNVDDLEAFLTLSHMKFQFSSHITAMFFGPDADFFIDPASPKRGLFVEFSGRAFAEALVKSEFKVIDGDDTTFTKSLGDRKVLKPMLATKIPGRDCLPCTGTPDYVWCKATLTNGPSKRPRQRGAAKQSLAEVNPGVVISSSFVQWRPAFVRQRLGVRFNAQVQLFNAQDDLGKHQFLWDSARFLKSQETILPDTVLLERIDLNALQNEQAHADIALGATPGTGNSSNPFGAPKASFGAAAGTFGASPTPFGASSGPFGVSPTPFGAASSAFRSSPSAFGDSPSVFGASPSALGASSNPSGAPPNPFGASPNPSGTELESGKPLVSISTVRGTDLECKQMSGEGDDDGASTPVESEDEADDVVEVGEVVSRNAQSLEFGLDQHRVAAGDTNRVYLEVRDRDGQLVTDPQQIVVTLRNSRSTASSEENKHDSLSAEDTHAGSDTGVGEATRFVDLKWASTERLALTKHNMLDHYEGTMYSDKNSRNRAEHISVEREFQAVSADELRAMRYAAAAASSTNPSTRADSDSENDVNRVKSFQCTTKCVSPGIYVVDWEVEEIGEFEFSVQIFGEHILGSPFSVEAFERKFEIFGDNSDTPAVGIGFTLGQLFTTLKAEASLTSDPSHFKRVFQLLQTVRMATQSLTFPRPEAAALGAGIGRFMQTVFSNKELLGVLAASDRRLSAAAASKDNVEAATNADVEAAESPDVEAAANHKAASNSEATSKPDVEVATSPDVEAADSPDVEAAANPNHAAN